MIQFVEFFRVEIAARVRFEQMLEDLDLRCFANPHESREVPVFEPSKTLADVARRRASCLSPIPVQREISLTQQTPLERQQGASQLVRSLPGSEVAMRARCG